MFRASMEVSGELGSLAFQGSLTLSQADEIKSALISAVNQARQIGIAFGDVESVDLSFLQLLCSAHKTAMALNKPFYIQEPLPEIIVNLIIDAGYAGESGCALDVSRSCPWVGRKRV